MKVYHKELLKRYVQYLIDCRYTYTTVNAYRRYIIEYLTNLDKPVNEVEEVNITRYLVHNILDVYQTYNARNRFVEAFILFFNHIVGKNYTMFGIAGKNYEPKLPVTLSRVEIKRIIENTSNIKHKAILSLIYYLGLKLEELINIKLIDFNINKHRILISKTRKSNERTIEVSDKLNKLVIEYIKFYLPKIWLFEGRGNKKYCSRSVQLLIKRSLKKNQIKQNASPSTFRHSLAAHLVENGTDLHLVQDYLGLCSLKSAKKYTQIVKVQKLNLSKFIEKGI